VDQLNSVDDVGSSFAPPLMCITEEDHDGIGEGQNVRFGVVIVTPSTGDVVWDDFDGGSTSPLPAFLTRRRFILPQITICAVSSRHE
jgi:hypothetical protein